MPRESFPGRRTGTFARLLLSAALIFVALPAAGNVAVVRAQEGTAAAPIPTIPPGEAYRQRNLVSDVPGLALVEDRLLVNPWGISMTATSPFWVANAGTNTSTLYRGDVGSPPSPLVINAGLPSINIPAGPPTGTVANTTNDFQISSGSASGPARFLFASLSGHITGWNPNVPAAGSRQAVIARETPGAVYTGLAIANSGGQNYLYAADVAGGQIHVFNTSFALQSNLSFPFIDPTIPPLYHPFNVQTLGGLIYVAYAKVDPTTGFDVKGFGAVSVFNTNGTFVRRIAIDDGFLSAPWGLAIAPASFGTFGGALLVGNFDFPGRINAYDPTTGAHRGTLNGESGTPIEIDGLWALTFGNGGAGGDPNALYFAAGISHEQHGLFGSLRPTTVTATSLVQFSTDDYAINEGAGHIDITITRDGDASGSASVDYTAFDEPGAGNASQKSDYEIALGTVRFAPGETSKTFRILLVDDLTDETDERVHLALSNPVNTGLGEPDAATLTILDNDASTSPDNPIDDAAFFVRQHYLDFFGREPDAAGLAFWTNQITSCGADAQCREIRRINVSAAFFLSTEFQQTGGVVYRAHKAAFGTLPRYGAFMRDLRAIGEGVIVGQGNWQEQLELNTQRFFDDFVQRPEFVARYGTMSNDEFVLALLGNAQISTSSGHLHIFRLDASQEVPPNTSPATGLGILRFSPNDIFNGFLSLSFSGLTSAQTDAHIHGPAPPGQNAGVLIQLPLGQFRDFPVTLTSQQRGFLGNGQLYVNVHTQNFQGGEIRGQIHAPRFFRDVLVQSLDSGLITRAQALRIVTDDEVFKQQERNASFVLMQYFGYLRRNPDDPPDNSLAGYNFWLGKLNQFNGDFIAAEMVKAFINSPEYRGRFRQTPPPTTGPDN